MLLLPTNVHVVVVVHDAARKLLVEVPGGSGVETADQAPRLPRSTIRRADPATTAMPTAVQAEAGGHETPNSAVTVAPEGVGAVGIDHVDAFHRSRSWVWAPEIRPYPTNAHDVVEPHETLKKIDWVVPVGNGVVTIDQLLPFHRRTRRRVVSVVWNSPTAQQLVVVGHETPRSAT